MGYGPPGGWNAGMPRPRKGWRCAHAEVAVRVRRWQCVAEVAVRGRWGHAGPNILVVSVVLFPWVLG